MTLIDDLLSEAQKKGIKDIAGVQAALKNGSLRDTKTPFVYGGNTTCSEVGHGDRSFFVDMGSGLREAGTAAMQKGTKEFHIFVTHMHWDHIMGLPFFVPVHVPGHKIHIYHVHKNAPEHIRINFNGVNFPLTWEQLNATIEFHQLKLYEQVTFGDVSVTPFVLDHPGGSFGYRFEADGKSLAIGVDGEYKRLTPKELGKDLRFLQNLDLMLFDAQYEMSELASRFDWGHCSPNIGVDLALREGIRTMLFTHHDPWANEDKIRRMADTTQKYMKSQIESHAENWKAQPEGPRLIMAFDGLSLEL